MVHLLILHKDKQSWKNQARGKGAMMIKMTKNFKNYKNQWTKLMLVLWNILLLLNRKVPEKVVSFSRTCTAVTPTTTAKQISKDKEERNKQREQIKVSITQEH